MKNFLTRCALFLGICLFATLTVPAQLISQYYEPLNTATKSYQSLLPGNPTINSSTWGTAAANDCSNSPAKFKGKNVIYVKQGGNDYVNGTVGPGTVGSPLGSGSGANAKIISLQGQNPTTNGGQLVCFETGTYLPFNINTSGTSSTNLVRFEVVPGNIAKIDLTCGGASNCWQTNGELYYGIEILPSTPSGSVSYVLVSGFYIQGPDELLSLPGSTAYTDAKTNLNDVGAPSAYYNAACIGIIGNQGYNHYVANGEADHIYIVANIAAGCPGGGIGAAFADYVTVDGNIVYDCNWYGVYGGSAISIGTSTDTNPTDPLYPNNAQGHTYKNYIVNNTVFNNIQFETTGSGAGNSPNGSLNDGEGIVIDSNLNNSTDPGVVPAGACNGSTKSYCSGPAYSGWTLISGNQVWGNGSSGIEATFSQNIDISFNTTFNNGVNQQETDRGEISNFDSLNINVYSNLLYTSGYDTSYVQGFEYFPAGSEAFYEQNYPYYGTATFEDNTAFSSLSAPIEYPASYPPVQVNDNGDNTFQFVSGAYAYGGAPQGSPYYGEYATDAYTVYNNGGLALLATSDPNIQNSTRYLSLTYDILGNPKPSSTSTVAAGAFNVAY